MVAKFLIFLIRLVLIYVFCAGAGLSRTSSLASGSSFQRPSLREDRLGSLPHLASTCSPRRFLLLLRICATLCVELFYAWIGRHQDDYIYHINALIFRLGQGIGGVHVQFVSGLLGFEGIPKPHVSWSGVAFRRLTHCGRFLLVALVSFRNCGMVHPFS